VDRQDQHKIVKSVAGIGPKLEKVVGKRKGGEGVVVIVKTR